MPRFPDLMEQQPSIYQISTKTSQSQLSRYENIIIFRDHQIFETPLQNSYTLLLQVCTYKSKSIDLLFL